MVESGFELRGRVEKVGLVWSVGVSVDEVVGDVGLFAEESVEVDFLFFELILRFFLLV